MSAVEALVALLGCSWGFLGVFGRSWGTLGRILQGFWHASPDFWAVLALKF